MHTEHRLWALLACCLLGTGAAHAEGPYGELRFGMVYHQPTTAEGSLRGFTSALPGRDRMVELEHEDTLSFGVEAGFEEVLGTPFKVGLGLDIFRSELESATLSATARNGAPVTRAAGPGALAAESLSFDQRVLLGTLNVFYEFEILKVAGYLGVGYGLAFVGDADAESGPVFHLGASYEVDPLGEVGLRVSRFKSGGPTHRATGLEFDDFEITLLSLSLGREF